MDQTSNLLDVAPPDSAALWDMYHRAKQRAEKARSEAQAAIYDLDPNTRSSLIFAAVDAHCFAQKALEDAARTLVDCLELPDNGRDRGVVFTLELAR